MAIERRGVPLPPVRLDLDILASWKPYKPVYYPETWDSGIGHTQVPGHNPWVTIDSNEHEEGTAYAVWCKSTGKEQLASILQQERDSRNERGSSTRASGEEATEETSSSS